MPRSAPMISPFPSVEEFAPFDMRQRILIIYNPIAGARRPSLLKSVQHALSTAGCAITLKPTNAKGDAEAFAREVALSQDHQGYDAVLVAGGDGTVNEALNGLQRAADEGCQSLPPLAILPMGTANVLAREIGLPVEAQAIAQAVLAGEARPVFCGEIKKPDLTPETPNAVRRFILMAGVGLDAHVVAHVNSRLKRLIGKGAYVWRTLQEIAANRTPKYHLRVEPVNGAPCIETTVAAAVLAKGRFYGGSFSCAKEARLTDPALHVCLFQHGGRLMSMVYGAALVFGLLPKMPGYKIIRARSVEIMTDQASTETQEPIQGDGDILSHLPAKLQLARHAQPLIMPATLS